MKQRNKAFWADKGALLSRDVALNLKFQRYSERIVPKILYSCGSWAWCQSLCQRVAVWEGKLLRRMLHAARKHGEEWLSWFRRSTNRAKNLYRKFGFEPLTLRVLREIHRTAGLLKPPPPQFTAATSTVALVADAFCWRDSWWWHQTQGLGQLLDQQ